VLYQMQQPAHKGPCVDCHDLSCTAQMLEAVVTMIGVSLIQEVQLSLRVKVLKVVA